MINTIVLLFTIFGIWIFKFILPPIVKKIRGDKLPNGSIKVNINAPIKTKRAPGKRWSQIAVAIGILYSYFILIDLVFHCIFGFWDSILIVDLPIWLNWIGIIGMWFLGVWVSMTFIYNVNYTPCTSQMKEIEYILATGGPYKYIRHPAYIAGVFENIFIFLATGVWIIFFGLIGFIALPYQVKEEEKMLKEMYGEIYDNYASKTSRFFPKILKGI